MSRSLFQFALDLTLPTRWNPRWAEEKFTQFYNYDVQLTKNKWFGSNSGYSSWYDLFFINLDIEVSGRSNAGPSLRIVILGFNLSVGFYDGREWNNDEKRWFKDEAEIEEHYRRHNPPESI